MKEIKKILQLIAAHKQEFLFIFLMGFCAYFLLLVCVALTKLVV